MMRVILYNKPACSLCDRVRADLLTLQTEIDFSLVEYNIEEDAALFERFRYLIPVLEINDGLLLYPPHTRQQIYSALRSAQQRPEA